MHRTTGDDVCAGDTGGLSLRLFSEITAMMPDKELTAPSQSSTEVDREPSASQFVHQSLVRQLHKVVMDFLLPQ